MVVEDVIRIKSAGTAKAICQAIEGASDALQGGLQPKTQNPEEPKMTPEQILAHYIGNKTEKELDRDPVYDKLVADLAQQSNLPKVDVYKMGMRITDATRVALNMAHDVTTAGVNISETILLGVNDVVHSLVGSTVKVTASALRGVIDVVTLQSPERK